MTNPLILLADFAGDIPSTPPSPEWVPHLIRADDNWIWILALVTAILIWLVIRFPARLRPMQTFILLVPALVGIAACCAGEMNAMHSMNAAGGQADPGLAVGAMALARLHAVLGILATFVVGLTSAVVLLVRSPDSPPPSLSAMP
jgi:hypothetical protein